MIWKRVTVHSVISNGKGAAWHWPGTGSFLLSVLLGDEIPAREISRGADGNLLYHTKENDMILKKFATVKAINVLLRCVRKGEIT